MSESIRKNIITSKLLERKVMKFIHSQKLKGEKISRSSLYRDAVNKFIDENKKGKENVAKN